MIRSFLLASVAVAPLVVFANSAQAACSSNKPVANATVVCTGIDTTGVKRNDKNAADNISVTVQSGASVSNASKADNHTIQLGNGAHVDVSGSVISAASSESDAINLGSNATVTLQSGASVTATNAKSDGVQADDGLTLTIDTGAQIIAGKKAVQGEDFANSSVTNKGTITAGTKGIDLGDYAYVMNAGTITAGTKTVDLGNFGVFENFGTITATTEGIELDDDGYVLNYGNIIADDDGINAGENVRIINYGLVHSRLDDRGIDLVQDALDIDSGTVENHGTILSDDDAAIDFDATINNDAVSTITNSGLIKGASGIIVETGHNDDGTLNGEAANEATQKVVNTAGGTIEATSGPVLKLGAGDDVYIGEVGSTLIGDSHMGDDNDTFQISTLAAIAGDVFLEQGNDSLIFTDSLAGATASFGLFDGGLGDDVVSFLAYATTDVAAVNWTSDVLNLSFADGFILALTNFETFAFTNATLTTAELSNLPLSAVPLPAPALMLLGALGGFGLLRSRRKA